MDRQDRDAPNPGSRLAFHDLGGIAVEREGLALPLTARRLQAATCLLLVHVNRRVSSNALIAALWSDAAPENELGSLQTQIWRLRLLLEPGRPRGDPHAVLMSDASGYRLVVEPAFVDSQRFGEAADLAHELLLAGDAARALTCCDGALSLWDGSPFAPFSDEDWARPAVSHLVEVRRQVVEQRVDCLLAIGDPETALRAVENDLGEFPLSERLWAARILASYRAGRTEQALETYHAARRTFVDAIGVEPGADLRELQRRILAEDPTLRGPRHRAVVTDHSAVEVTAPLSQVGPLPTLVGREDDLQRLDSALAHSGCVTVVGPGGVGKTRLALEVTVRAVPEHADEVCLVELAAARDAGQVIDAVTSALGVAVGAAGDARTAVAAFVRGRRVLVVLDNCEHVLEEAAELAEILQSGRSGPTVLATSREPLGIVGEVVVPLAPLAVPSLPDQRSSSAELRGQPAIALFLERYDRVAPETMLDADDLETVARICQAVEALPLAVELAAALGGAFSLGEIEARVRMDPSDLTSIGGRRRGHHRSLHDALDRSLATLTPVEVLVHARLAAVPGPMTATVAAALNPDLTLSAVQDALAGLVHRSMLVALPRVAVGSVSRFVQLATIRAHARHCSASDVDAVEPARLLDAWVSELVSGRPRLGSPVEVQWHQRLDDDLTTVRGCLQRTLVESPHPLGVWVASRLDFFWYYRGMSAEGQRWLELARAQDGVLEGLERVVSRFARAELYGRGGQMGVALAELEPDRIEVDEFASGPLIIIGEHAATFVSSAFIAGEADVCGRYAGMVSVIAARTGDASLRLLAEVATLQADSLTGDPETQLARAATLWEQAIAMSNVYVQRIAAGQATVAALRLRRPDVGLWWSTRVLQHHQQLALDQAPMLMEICADLLSLARRPDTAARLYRAAQVQSHRAGLRWPQQAFSAELYRRTIDVLSVVQRQQADADGARLTLHDLPGLMARID